MDSEQPLREQVESLERQVRALQAGVGAPGVRRRSDLNIFGMPLYDIAIGPDLERQEVRGHARGFIAIGDFATGVFALGGIARGVFVCGGVALGLFSLGGCSIGLLVAVGGFALGTFALGGAAIGVVAVGGGAVGYYAYGGGAVGRFVVSPIRQDPEAIELFSHWFPNVKQMLPNRGG